MKPVKRTNKIDNVDLFTTAASEHLVFLMLFKQQHYFSLPQVYALLDGIIEVVVIR
jgi:hypothetical protein